jgi:hypothetical protein
MDSTRLIACIAEPIAIQVATRTEDLVPRSVRGFGVRFDAESNVLSVGVLDAQATEFLAALRSSNAIAVNLTHPVSIRGVQVKGPVLSIEEPSTEAAEAAAAYWSGFLKVVVTIGFEPEVCRGMFHSGAARWVTMRPVQMFDQTPGPGAGRRL